MTVTGTGAESRVRNAFHAIFQKSATLQDAPPGGSVGGGLDVPDTGISPPPPLPSTPTPKKTVQLVSESGESLILLSPPQK